MHVWKYTVQTMVWNLEHEADMIHMSSQAAYLLSKFKQEILCT